jgi:hypothetical protein
MAPISLISLGLKAFTAFWALVTWIVAAAFVGQLNSYGQCLSLSVIGRGQHHSTGVMDV